MPDQSDYRFTESHEWFHLDGDVVTMRLDAVELEAPGRRSAYVALTLR